MHIDSKAGYKNLVTVKEAFTLQQLEFIKYFERICLQSIVLF